MLLEEAGDKELQQLVLTMVNDVLFEEVREKQLFQRRRQVELFKQTASYYKLKTLEFLAPSHYVQWLLDGPEISLKLSKRKFWRQISKWKKHIHICVNEGVVKWHHYQGVSQAPFV